MNISVVTESVTDLILRCKEKGLRNVPLTFDEALAILQLDNSYLFDLLAATTHVRRHYKGDEVSLCSIINAKSGHCPEDCAFCSQSAHVATDAPEFELVPPERVLEGARSAKDLGAHKFGVVTSGYGFSGAGRKKDVGAILDYIEAMKSGVEMHRCASLGIIDESTARLLKEAGLAEYHHNLETARSFFPQICTTHSYDEDVATVKAVKKAGLRICCGGIFGMGESDEQRVEFAFTLRDLDVDSIPINFLNPIDGTPLQGREPLPPLTCLKIIALFRLVAPDKDIKVAGGRERNLGEMQSMMFAAGANSTMVGNYLTTMGRPASEDLKMIADLGLTLKGS